jgi:hypothetical protein
MRIFSSRVESDGHSLSEKFPPKRILTSMNLRRGDGRAGGERRGASHIVIIASIAILDPFQL